MKLVKGIVRVEKVTDIARALTAAGVSGLTVTEARGQGSTPHTGVYRGIPFIVLTPMAVIDVIVSDDAAEGVAQVLIEYAHTGEHGDGHVVVMAVEERYSIRTRWLDVA